MATETTPPGEAAATDADASRGPAAPADADASRGPAVPAASRESRPRSRRDRPAKPALSRDAIVEAGLQIVRKEGIDALTMRRIAQALDTGPASLYVYVANRDELWELLFDAAIASVTTEPTDPSRWREQ